MTHKRLFLFSVILFCFSRCVCAQPWSGILKPTSGAGACAFGSASATSQCAIDNQFFADEKVLAVIDHSRQTSGGGTVFVQSGGSYKPGETTTVPQLTMALEHWTRIARLLQQKKDVSLELNVTNTFYDDDPMQYDTIAEIPGTDRARVVIPRRTTTETVYWYCVPSETSLSLNEALSALMTLVPSTNAGSRTISIWSDASNAPVFHRTRPG